MPIRGLIALTLVLVSHQSFTRTQPTHRTRDDCTVFVPSLGDNPIFVAGEENTITWDTSDVPSDACVIPSFEFDSIHSVIISTLATDIDPFAGTLTFTLPAVTADPYIVAFNAVDGRHAVFVSVRVPS